MKPKEHNFRKCRTSA